MRPKILIASSRESLPVVNAVFNNLDDEFECTPWPHLFWPSSYPLDDLIGAVETHDYGVFVLAPDDKLELRGNELLTPRDNVIFESGLFIGKHGRSSHIPCLPRRFTDAPLAQRLHRTYHRPLQSEATRQGP